MGAIVQDIISNARLESAIDFNLDEASSLKEVMASFDTCHVVVLRNVLQDREKAIRVRDSLDHFFESVIPELHLSDSDQYRSLALRQQLSAQDLAAFQDCPLDGILAGWLLGNFKASFLHFVRTALSGGVRVNLSKTSIRKKSNKDSFLLPFHQDARGPTTINPRVLTCWVPLCSVGLNRPGLEVIVRPHEVIYGDDEDEYGYRGPRDRIKGPGDQWVLDCFGEYLVCPRLNVGDCLIFTGDVLHRSQPLEQADSRISIDMRLFSESDQPDKFRDDVSVELA